MADNLPDAPWISQQQSVPTELPDAPWVASQPSALEKAIEPITSLPSTYQQMVQGSLGEMQRGVGQISSGEPWEIAKGIGNVALGGLGYVTAPIGAPLHTIVGHPVEENVANIAGPTAGKIAGTLAETAAGFALPAPKMEPRFPTMPESPYGITLSKGEQLGDLALRQKEQEELRLAGSHAQNWMEQRKAQIDAANRGLIGSLDPYQQSILAQTPQEAGELVSQGAQSAANIGKQGVTAAYQQAKSYPGVIHAGVFEGFPQKIKGDLTLTGEPVYIDQGTPNAQKMINYLDQKIGSIKIPNAADPFGPPNPENITGVTLPGVEQWRKALSTLRGDALKSGNASDSRAARAVLRSFDDHIDNAIDNGMFSGDPGAVQAWKNARAAHADYVSTFGGGGSRDAAGRVVQKILGKGPNDPLTATKVIDQIVGSSGVAPSSLNIAVANRLKGILGERSPEWIAAKQGILSRLIETPEGLQTLGTGQTATRLSKFLNSDIAPQIYSPREMATLRGYANLMRKITMPPGNYFPSAPPIQRALAVIGNRTGQIIGALIGRQLTPGIPLIGEFAGITAGGKLERALTRSHLNVSENLPILSDKVRQWERAQAVAQTRPNAMTQRIATGSTLALQKELSKWGINLFDVMQSPAMAPADTQQQQNQVPGQPSQ